MTLSPIAGGCIFTGKRMVKKRVAVLISGRGSNMAALIEAAKERSYPAEIALVVSNRPDAAGLARAEAHAIPTAVVDHRAYGKDRAAFERALQAALDEHRVELVCLGGFMRLLTQDFVLRWQGRMLNIHPALLPSFPGLDPSSRRPMPARSLRKRRCPSATTIPPRRSLPVFSMSSIDCIRWRSGSWPSDVSS